MEETTITQSIFNAIDVQATPQAMCYVAPNAQNNILNISMQGHATHPLIFFEKYSDFYHNTLGLMAESDILIPAGLSSTPKQFIDDSMSDASTSHFYSPKVNIWMASD